MGNIGTEDKTRPYAVYITDEENTAEGSGVLFYPGGNQLFVFTCAHVVDRADRIKLVILKAVNIERDLYQVFQIQVPKEQILYSPLDIVTEESGEKVHSEDIAIIQVQKPEELLMEETQYFFGDTLRNSPVYAQGYPNGMPEKSSPIGYLECFHGIVVVNAANEDKFSLRITDGFLDQGNRVYELKGISGAPVWDGQETDGEQELSLLGLMSSAYGQTALLSKVFATKLQRIRVMMKEKFGIVIERKLLGIPEEDVACGQYKPMVFDGKVAEKEPVSENERWLGEQAVACRCHIGNLQLQQAIDTAKEAIGDPRFSSCGKKVRKHLMQHLLYCYEIGDLDQEFEELEETMRNEGLLEAHDPMRHLTRSFMKKEYRETIAAAEEYIRNGRENKTLYACANVFLLLARAYADELPVEETIGKLIDEQENFVYSTGDEDDAALIYQMIGYVYGERYHDYVNAVRFLNRSYRIGMDSVILESLGAAYYFLGISDAVMEDDRVDQRKVDRRALYKARECFLSVSQKADELFWAGTMRRAGLCIYNTFYFLSDNYRILTVYPDVKKYVEPVDPPMGEDAFWRDIEMKYARVMAQSGNIDLFEYPHITSADRILLETTAEMSRWNNTVEQIAVQAGWRRINDPELEKQLKKAAAETENNIRRMDVRDRFPVYIQLMNLYGRGMVLFGWKKIDKLKYCLERIQGYHDPDVMESMENYLYEFEAPIGDVIARFRDTFERKPSIITWQELNHLYIRHGMMDRVDAMYKELFADRRELIEEEPEYAYRAYIDYVTMYHRDLRDALRCYLDSKETFRDTDIEGFWELELMLYSNTFNEPERFETERQSFLERGLITEEQFHRTALIAYLTNLKREKAEEHFWALRDQPHPVDPMTGMVLARPEEIHFLNWIRKVQPHHILDGSDKTRQRANQVDRGYSSESWHVEVDGAMKKRFQIDKRIALDAWGLYILTETTGLDILKKLDMVFVPHMTVIQLLDDLAKTGSDKVREILDFIGSEPNIRLQSAGFKAQMPVRNAVERYSETAATVAVGKEQDALIVLGDPKLAPQLVERYRHLILRVNELENLLGA